ncbi:hypothetical protein LEMLEM_LOCUS16297, partial [Lemmus lemmus]
MQVGPVAIKRKQEEKERKEDHNLFPGSMNENGNDSQCG